MSIENDIKREFRYQSEYEKRAIRSSWESFLDFASKIVSITSNIIDALYKIWQVVQQMRG